MKAVVQTRYGAPDEVLEIREVPKPACGADEVLVRVRAASVHPDVWHMVTGRPYFLRCMGAGLRRPKNPIPGIDMAGEVEAVGGNVTGFAPGDAVFGESHTGFQWVNGGAYAEYVAVPSSVLALKPEAVPFAEAASVPTAGIIAFDNLRACGPLQASHKVLINGAAGCVGSIALQLAKAAGAHVTAVDATHKLELMRRLGADAVVDYTKGDITTTSERYDLLFDVASNLTFSGCKRLLTPTGKYIWIGHDHFGRNGKSVFGSIPHALGLVARSLFDRRLPRLGPSTPKGEVMGLLKALLESGKLTPMVDKVFPLEQVGDALRYLQEGRAVGRIVLVP